MFDPAAAISRPCFKVSRNRFSSAMTWSEGNIPITASGSSRNSKNAASPMAGAVLRPTGSASTCGRESRGSCFRIAGRRSSLVMTQNFFTGASGSRRATVCCSIVCLPSSASSCLARFFRLNGQKRVPRPPARITGWKLGFLDKVVGFQNSRFKVTQAQLSIVSA